MKNKILKILEGFLAILSKKYILKKKVKVIWITGSVWKTSARMIVYQILNQFIKNKKLYTSPKNFNSELWLIFSIFEIEKYNPWVIWLLKNSLIILFKTIISKPNYDIIVLEYWIDHPGDMDFLLNVVKPDISIFTKLDTVHLEYFKNLEWIWDEKFKLMLNTKERVYLNAVDEYCKSHSYLVTWKDIIFYNWEEIKKNNFKISKNENNIFYSEFRIGDKNIKTNLLWEENINYIQVWLDIMDHLIGDKWIKRDEYILDFELQRWRYNIFAWINNSVLIDSTYNAWPESMKKMIENTFRLKKEALKWYRVAFVLWDMRELWKNTKDAHLWLKSCLDKADLVYTVWKEMKKHLKYKDSFLSSKLAWEKLKELLSNTKNKYVILFKWSQNTIFTEEALKQVLLNDEDVKDLVRQDRYWLYKKEV